MSMKKQLSFTHNVNYPTRTDNPDAIKQVKANNIFIVDHRMKLSIDFCAKGK